ncbi:protein transport protein HofC [Lonsdalea populi]|uniref:protein transport protein HofC n=1 Tax=Lonsdalea populi TaxID=1172565 RepID=UPI000A232D95|nr:protein transport protein HofC [Lonsdalea populi]OSM98469.1 type IV pilin biogenesis protein [Lonsdalea populi]RAT67477.1 type IV pilin biogenesis protein [Lonsdalea populi]RAT74812.1 type IV pilin biogenesis protein [Lonsdalea populi]RAT75559.1 type IV pilin biogenesis protein [Lonsdalea populi]RAT76728.1 type IV pilin biogenesis protein [Lonsdalea populi]
MAMQKLYDWQALSGNGELCCGELIATQRQQVYDHLLELGYQPLNLKVRQYLTRYAWRSTQLTAVIHQLGSLLQAGLPLLESLNLMARQHDKPAWRCVLHSVGRQVAQGMTLAEALRHHPHIFPPMYCSLIAAGELTGKLGDCCQRLAAYQEARHQLAHKVAKALRYPLFVSAAVLMVSTLMITLVLPEFGRLYASFNAPLPVLTQTLLTFSEQCVLNGAEFVASSIVLAAAYGWLRKAYPYWRHREQRLWLRAPGLATLIRGRCLSQIFHTLAMTHGAGLPLPAGLSAAATLGHPLYQLALKEIQSLIERGIPLSQAVERSPLFPAPCPQLIRVGEETGALAQLFTQLADWHEKSTQQFAEKLPHTLEPLLMGTVGVIVGTLVIAMYLPIFQLGHVLTGA